MEKLLEISEPEIRINFLLNTKCRCNLLLRSLCPSVPVAFKVQTSSPHKFLVNPPSGLVPPLSHVALQIVLKPQDRIPPTFPRSHSDRFLIRSARFDSDSSDSVINFLLSTRPTQDIKLKVAFVGPFLLQHAVSCGDCEVVKNMIRRQKSILYDLTSTEAESILGVATRLPNSEDMVNLLLEAGLRTDVTHEEQEEYGHTVDFNKTEALLGLLREGRHEAGLDLSKGNIGCVQMLVESGLDVNARSNDGRTALYRAAANYGNGGIVEMLIKLKADPSILNDHGSSALDVAREMGCEKIVEIVERGEQVLMAARRGDKRLVESVVNNDKGGAMNYEDQYGWTALHAAAMKGYKEVVLQLVEMGSDLERSDNEGHTALHLAVEGGHLEVVEALIRKGANANAETKRGATPFYMAKKMGNHNISRLLLNTGRLALDREEEVLESHSNIKDWTEFDL